MPDRSLENLSICLVGVPLLPPPPRYLLRCHNYHQNVPSSLFVVFQSCFEVILRRDLGYAWVHVVRLASLRMAPLDINLDGALVEALLESSVRAMGYMEVRSAWTKEKRTLVFFRLVPHMCKCICVCVPYGLSSWPLMENPAGCRLKQLYKQLFLRVLTGLATLVVPKVASVARESKVDPRDRTSQEKPPAGLVSRTSTECAAPRHTRSLVHFKMY